SSGGGPKPPAAPGGAPPPGGAPTTAASGGAATSSSGGGGTGTCKAGTAKDTPIATQTGNGQGKTVGLLFDVTGRGDKSFNDGAAAGLDKSKADFKITGSES